MADLWVIYISIAGVSSVLFNYINRYVLKENDDSTAYAWWFEIYRSLIFLPFCFLVDLPKFNFSNFLVFVSIGLSEFFSVYFYMKMHSKSELSISTIVAQLRLVWVPIIAFIFLKEQLILKEYLGIIFIFLGQSAVFFRGKAVINSGVKYALMSSIFVATNSILIKIGSPVFDAPFIVLAMGLPTIFLFPVLMKNARYRIRSFGSRKWKKIVGAAMFNCLTMLFMIWALKFGPVSKVVGIFQGMSVLGVLAGIFFLNEKENITNKIIGSFIVLFGVFLLI